MFGVFVVKNLNKLESEPRKLGVITRAMAQRVLEERTEGTEKEVVGLKEMMLEMKKSMDRLTEEMRENHSYKKREESGTSGGSVMKLKGKMEEFNGTNEGTQGTMDRSKYKKLEMPMFLGETLNLGFTGQNTSLRLTICQKQKR